jgi:sugar phosphate isomerase/epimerase
MSDHTLNRRTLLGAVPGAAALTLSLARRSRAQEYKLGGADFKLGVASYSFRKFSRAQAIAMTKQLGTPYLNIKDSHLKMESTPEEIEAAKQEFKNGGIILTGIGTVYFKSPDEADIRSKFEYAKKLDVPLIVAGPTTETLPKLEKFVKEYDIKIAVHNHGPEDKYFPTPQSVLKVVKDMDPRMGCCVDIGHTERTGVNLIETIAEVGPRLLDMHVKDLANLSQKDSQVAVGEGKIPFGELFLQLIKMKYTGCVNLEYEIHADNPMPGMQQSFSYMHGVLTGIKASQFST